MIRCIVFTTGYVEKSHQLITNLPYGTHVLEFSRPVVSVTVSMITTEFIIHQPKESENIPDTAITAGEYMLMADFVPATTTGKTEISKGTRKIYIPPFRLLYAYKDNKIYLLDFDHRSKIYKKRK